MTDKEEGPRREFTEPVDLELEQDRHLFLVGRTEGAARIEQTCARIREELAGAQQMPGPPPAPAQLEATELPGPVVYLSWRPVREAARYGIRRDRGAWNLTDDDRTACFDRFVAAGQSYSYSVASVSTDGALGPPTPELDLLLQAPPVTSPPSAPPWVVIPAPSPEPDDVWTPRPGGPLWGRLTHRLDFGEPVALGDLLGHRAQIIAGLVASDPSASSVQGEPSYLDVSIASGPSLDTLNSFEGAKGLSDFVADLQDVGSGLVFRVDDY